MACDKCRDALPYLLGFPQVESSIERVATIKECPYCGTFYEVPGLEWVPPTEVNEDHIRKYYPKTWQRLHPNAP